MAIDFKDFKSTKYPNLYKSIKPLILNKRFCKTKSYIHSKFKIHNLKLKKMILL